MKAQKELPCGDFHWSFHWYICQWNIIINIFLTFTFPDISSNFYFFLSLIGKQWFPTFREGLQTSQIFWQPSQMFWEKIPNICCQISLFILQYYKIHLQAANFPKYIPIITRAFPSNFCFYKAPNVLNRATAASVKLFDLKLNIKWTRYCPYLIFVIYFSTDKIWD